MKKVSVYTDGACSGNPGPGGWGAVLIYGDKKREMSGGEAHTTNNRMELRGVIEALSALTEPCEVALYTDSKYVSDAINKRWLDKWVKQGWRKADGEVKNPDLWQELLPLLERHRVNFVWVRGHAENEYNNRCDELAVRYRLRFTDGG
jgi:ribonuclease HI